MARLRRQHPNTGCGVTGTRFSCDIDLNPGEFLIVPRGVEHCPKAEEEVEIILFEPADTRNTGNVENELTAAPVAIY